MVEYMLSNIITHEFEKVAGKGQGSNGKAMHIGFHLHTENDDQYRVAHLYIYAPMNYVYVVSQEERIDKAGKRHVGKMQLLCYHDSCWRDSIKDFIWKNRDQLGTMTAFGKLFDWYDVLTLSVEETDFLRKMDHWKYSYPYPKGDFEEPNPFDKRGNWAGKAEEA